MRMHPLRVFREKHDPPLSQEELAGLLDVSRAAVCRWENGKRFPGRDKWADIKKLTGYGAEDLVASGKR